VLDITTHNAILAHLAFLIVERGAKVGYSPRKCNLPAEGIGLHLPMAMDRTAQRQLYHAAHEKLTALMDDRQLGFFNPLVGCGAIWTVSAMPQR
jgi:hypothetical protein